MSISCRVDSSYIIDREHRPACAIRKIDHPLATIWLSREECAEAAYFYGGTRLIDSAASDACATQVLIRLTCDESGIKNRLINRAIRMGALDDLRTQLPAPMLMTSVAGARCLIQPRTPDVAFALSDSQGLNGSNILPDLLKCLGDALSEYEPRIKLTPDFGRNAGLADILFQFTPNVLGIRCEEGGCGGKSSYSTTGVIAAIEHASRTSLHNTPVTCIGSAGAMGRGIVDYLMRQEVQDLAVCDLQYDRPNGPRVPDGCLHLKSRPGAFTDDCIKRGGMLIATTIGDELEKSQWKALPPGTLLVLAHNMAFPESVSGTVLARSLAEQGILAIPGQVLTLGGALTARLEWFWRQRTPRESFDKSLAHQVVRRVVVFIVSEMLSIAKALHITPLEAMQEQAGLGGRHPFAE